MVRRCVKQSRQNKKKMFPPFPTTSLQKPVILDLKPREQVMKIPFNFPHFHSCTTHANIHTHTREKSTMKIPLNPQIINLTRLLLYTVPWAPIIKHEKPLHESRKFLLFSFFFRSDFSSGFSFILSVFFFFWIR